ncbi:mitochondrial carrier domain-containing protein [Cantharellus anzutake]|uniref:mitochondrial carrier domain-containing protein n=1 Tax=Cantharellus anzutake TaxID=1750568 RepID=UPI0019086932|nr:mitochondrial carrier domain-containing protein [Cantharellus anzutake]KAF8326699.1 mitochondrial carrier domain-containing protein [Cantharellus anzutake]
MSSVIHATSGAAAGIFAMTLTYPLIFLSTRAAVQVRGKDKSTYEAVIDIIKSEGVAGMYSGLNSSLLGIGITNGVYYYFYEKSREIILKGREKGVSQALTTPESMLAGLIAGSATTAISNPIWVVQTTQAVQTVQEESSLPTSPSVKKLNLVQTVKYILKKGGIGAFWRGIGPALVLVINPIIQYTIFEQLKNWLIARRTARLREQTGLSRVVAVLSDLDFFFLGAVSKLGTSMATSATYPYIVIKSRLQAGHDSALRYKSSIDGILTVIKEEGVSGLYKGVGSKLVQSVLTAAILFAGQKRIYETTRAALTSVPVKR